MPKAKSRKTAAQLKELGGRLSSPWEYSDNGHNTLSQRRHDAPHLLAEQGFDRGAVNVVDIMIAPCAVPYRHEMLNAQPPDLGKVHIIGGGYVLKYLLECFPRLHDLGLLPMQSFDLGIYLCQPFVHSFIVHVILLSHYIAA